MKKSTIQSKKEALAIYLKVDSKDLKESNLLNDNCETYEILEKQELQEKAIKTHVLPWNKDKNLKQYETTFIQQYRKIKIKNKNYYIRKI